MHIYAINTKIMYFTGIDWMIFFSPCTGSVYLSHKNDGKLQNYSNLVGLI